MDRRTIVLGLLLILGCSRGAPAAPAPPAAPTETPEAAAVQVLELAYRADEGEALTERFAPAVLGKTHTPGQRAYLIAWLEQNGYSRLAIPPRQRPRVGAADRHRAHG